jgi:hypothetical protein
LKENDKTKSLLKRKQREGREGEKREGEKREGNTKKKRLKLVQEFFKIFLFY